MKIFILILMLLLAGEASASSNWGYSESVDFFTDEKFAVAYSKNTILRGAWVKVQCSRSDLAVVLADAHFRVESDVEIKWRVDQNKGRKLSASWNPQTSLNLSEPFSKDNDHAFAFISISDMNSKYVRSREQHKDEIKRRADSLQHNRKMLKDAQQELENAEKRASSRFIMKADRERRQDLVETQRSIVRAIQRQIEIGEKYVSLEYTNTISGDFLLKELREGTSLAFQIGDGKIVQVSLAGSSALIEKVGDHCNK